MIVAVIIVSFLLQSQVSVEVGTANLVRVCVLPAAETPDPDLFESAKNLVSAFLGKKKDLLVVTAQDRPDVVVTVTSRSVIVPRVAIGVAPPTRAGDPGASFIREFHVTAMLAAGKDAVEIRNKNSPLISANGWKSSDDDVAKQVEKWIAEHKKAILDARGGA